MINLLSEVLRNSKKFLIVVLFTMPMTLCAQTKLDSLHIEFVTELINSQADSIIGPNNTTSLDLTKEEAIKLGLFYARKIYGKKKVREEYPFKTGLLGDYWVLIGDSKFMRQENVVGGRLYVIINRKNGAVVYITHTR